MAKDQNKTPKNKNKTRGCRGCTKRSMVEPQKKYKNNESSDNDDSIYSESESDPEMDMLEYNKMLQSIFPSAHMKNKIKAMEKVPKTVEGEASKTSKKTKTKKFEEVKEEGDEESSYDEEYEGDDDYDDEIDIMSSKRGNGNFNIIFTISDPLRDEDEDEDEDEDYDEDEDEDYEDEDEDYNDEDYHEDEEHAIKETVMDKLKKNAKVSSKEEELDDEDVLDEIHQTLDKLWTDKKNKTLDAVLSDIDARKEKLEVIKEKEKKKEKKKNMKKLKKLLQQKSNTNDISFFRDKLDTDQQTKIITELEEIQRLDIVDKPYRLQLLESTIPTHLKATALKKITNLRYMEPGSGEYYKIKNWVDTFMRLPFQKYNSLPVTMENKIEECHSFMENAQKILDDAVYGLNDAKMQVMQMMGQWIANPKAVGSAIAISGPMGTGKTTLVKEGISKILNREFAFIALGGATDSSFLEGHSYTYEGSSWGKIIDIILRCKCMNPVIYFDELDKISDTPKGEEIIGILTHLTDTAQNTQFHDKYFSEIDFDLSKCLFIFSYNDESKVNPILLDRMYRIETEGYKCKEKITIARNYLLPTIREQVKFGDEDIIIPDETIEYLVENYTEKEEGVRNLKRCLEIIHTKLNLYRLMKPGTNLFEKDISLKVEFPFTVTKETIEGLIKKTEDDPHINSMYI